MSNQQQTVEATLAERGSRYGKFSDHARIAQKLQDVLRGYTVTKTFLGKERTIHPWQRLPQVHAQALTVICDKIARVMSGDCNYLDNWHDIQGYAKLVEDYIKQQCGDERAGIEPVATQESFKAGEIVMVRDSDAQKWMAATYVCTAPTQQTEYRHVAITGDRKIPTGWKQCKRAD